MRLPAILETGVPRRIFISGFVGSCLLALGGIGSGATPYIKDVVAQDLHLTWTKHNSVTSTIATLMVAVGMVLLASAWWQLRPLLYRLSPKAVLVVAAVWMIPLFIGPPLFSRDVYAYAGQGHLVANHYDPYKYGPSDYEPTSAFSSSVDPVWQFKPSPYGPVWLSMAGMVVRLSQDHLVVAIFGLRVLAVFGLLLIAWALPKLAISHGVAPQRALWLGLANPLILIHGVSGAHNDALMIGVVACGLVVAGRSPTAFRLIGASAIITIAVLIKLPAVAALGFLPMLLPTWRERGRAVAVIAPTTAFVATSLTLISGLGWGWVETLNEGSARLSIFSPVTGLGVGLGTILKDIGLVSTSLVVTRIVLAGGLAVAGALALFLLLRSHSLGPQRALGLTLIAVVALGPTVQPWYLLWGLVLLAAVIGDRAELALGALSVALCLAILPNGRSLIRPPLYGAPVIAAVALAVFEVRRGRQVLDEDDVVSRPLVSPVQVSV